jgi:hypothetical protein
MYNPIVDRIRLLMEYDMSKTSSENLSLIQETGRALLTVLKSAPRSLLDDVVRGVKFGLKDNKGNILKTSDDVLKAAQRGILDSNSAGKIRMSFLRQPGISKSIRTDLIDEFAKNPNVYGKYRGQDIKTIATKFRNANFSDDVSNEIARKIVAANKAVGKVAVTTTRTATRNVKAIPQGNYRGISSTIWTKAGQVIRTMSWLNFLKWGLKLGLSAAVIYYLWKWFTGEDPKDEDGNVVPQPKPESKYRDCEGQEVITMGCKSSDVRRLQGCIGVEADGAWGPDTQKRMVELGLGQGLSVSDIDQICKTQDDVEQEAEQNANDKLYPKVRGSEAEFDVSSNSSNTNVDLTLSTGSVDDFS